MIAFNTFLINKKPRYLSYGGSSPRADKPMGITKGKSIWQITELSPSDMCPKLPSIKKRPVLKRTRRMNYREKKLVRQRYYTGIRKLMLTDKRRRRRSSSLFKLLKRKMQIMRRGNKVTFVQAVPKRKSVSPSPCDSMHTNYDTSYPIDELESCGTKYPYFIN